MGNIYLIGFMGCGKSTISRYLCKLCGYKRLEMDEEIEKREGCSIREIFDIKGEAYFREAETSLLKSFRGREQLVVSCGGGTAMRQENVAEMKDSGTVVLLQAAPETVFRRVRHSHNRPLLEGKMTVAYIEELMEKRRPVYEEAADLCVVTDNRTTEEICQEILDKLHTT